MPLIFYKMSNKDASDKPRLTRREELALILRELDEIAEEIGASDVRRAIADVIADLPESAGKEAAQLAIRDFRVRLGLDMAVRKPVYPPNSPAFTQSAFDY